MRVLQFLAILLTLASIQCLSVDMLNKIKTWRGECIDETGNDRDFVVKALTEHKYPDEAKFKDFILCMTKKFGVVDDQGNLHPEVFKKVLLSEGQSDAAADDLVKKCAVVKGSAEDSAFSMFVCHQNSAPKELQI
uniref:OBP2 n=1 Tax=Hycleus phaleratus TaxID=1248972 RepID=A0A2U9NJI0_9CUCU|nr:OBP2 [Hycleus phaleratus]